MTRPQHGFTLVELLITLAVMGIISVFSFPFFRSYAAQQQFDSVNDELSASLHRTQGKAMSGENGSPWGIHWGSGQYTIFSGTNYNERDPQFDIPVSYSSSVTIDTSAISGMNPYPQDLLFQQLSGEILTPGTLRLSSKSDDSESYLLQSSGQIERQ